MENLFLNLKNRADAYEDSQNLANQATNIFDQRQKDLVNRDLVNQAAMEVFRTGFNNRNNGIMEIAPQTVKDTIASNLLYDDMASGGDFDYDYDYESIQPLSEDELKTSNQGGLAGLLRAIVGFAVPGAGLFMGDKSALEGIRSLNQRLRSTDFAQAKTLADYFDMRSYGGLREREKQRAETMAQARGIQKQMAQRPSAVLSARDFAMGKGEGDGPQGDAFGGDRGVGQDAGTSGGTGGRRGGAGRN